jgi:hypothetical protein
MGTAAGGRGQMQKRDGMLSKTMFYTECPDNGKSIQGERGRCRDE